MRRDENNDCLEMEFARKSYEDTEMDFFLYEKSTFSDCCSEGMEIYISSFTEAL